MTVFIVAGIVVGLVTGALAGWIDGRNWRHRRRK